MNFEFLWMVRMTYTLAGPSDNICLQMINKFSVGACSPFLVPVLNVTMRFVPTPPPPHLPAGPVPVGRWLWRGGHCIRAPSGGHPGAAGGAHRAAWG